MEMENSNQEVLGKVENITRGVIESLGIKEAMVKAEWQEPQERIYVSVEAAAENGFLIGKDGRMLEALKEIVEAATSRFVNRRLNLYFDVGEYWAKIEKDTLEKAQLACEQVRRSGRPYLLEPMHALLRRFLHKALKTQEGIETASEGEGDWRRMTILPKR